MDRSPSLLEGDGFFDHGDLDRRLSRLGMREGEGDGRDNHGQEGPDTTNRVPTEWAPGVNLDQLWRLQRSGSNSPADTAMSEAPQPAYLIQGSAVVTPTTPAMLLNTMQGQGHSQEHSRVQGEGQRQGQEQNQGRPRSNSPPRTSQPPAQPVFYTNNGGLTLPRFSPNQYFGDRQAIDPHLNYIFSGGQGNPAQPPQTPLVPQRQRNFREPAPRSSHAQQAQRSRNTQPPLSARAEPPYPTTVAPTSAPAPTSDTQPSRSARAQTPYQTTAAATNAQVPLSNPRATQDHGAVANANAAALSQAFGPDGDGRSPSPPPPPVPRHRELARPQRPNSERDTALRYAEYLHRLRYNPHQAEVPHLAHTRAHTRGARAPPVQAGYTPHPATVRSSGPANAEHERRARDLGQILQETQRAHWQRVMNEAVAQIIMDDARPIPQPGDLRGTLDDRSNGRPEAKEPHELQANLECKICFSQIVDTVLLPCGHASMCQWCADVQYPGRRYDPSRPIEPAHCIICRADVKMKMRIYLN
ncbi:hypothetical protein BO70DRAFT_431136 [Aspergillus heteromorphus CBS 117.55]|uniref:RING-type domain-containing protein n=1 Tax=Aspergillus heteromorphus CBS 117.55 TaxID=1448321 RepID=A0A317VQJ6_9EURO|nr:uncharacterized protein BO70DRAFT_431136 [Aspergillus heteromorphus CBS 117.55]PWY75162.1 hypothetical protein BO70DRAFT_431136 [Aspergillus heteromorphus CBS 117.55]